MTEPANFDPPKSANAIVHVPALGFGVVTGILTIAGLFFIGMGAFFDAKVAERPPADAFLFWFLRGFCWAFILAGVFLTVWAAVEVMRKYELTIDNGYLQREAIIGPARWRQRWPPRCS